MDILKPQILTIDGRRYRKMPYTSSEGNSSEIEAQKIESGTRKTIFYLVVVREKEGREGPTLPIRGHHPHLPF